MALIYYAKLNLNSDIFKTKQYDGKIDLKKELEDLYNNINDDQEYEYILPAYKSNRTGSIVANKDTYNFSELKKVKNNDEWYITGSIVRRFPYYSEAYDSKKKVSRKVKYEDNSSSIKFYFDVKNEIIAFCTKKNFGQNQFIRAFQNLINLCNEKREFCVYMIIDSSPIKEKIKKAKHITYIKSTLVAANVNEEHIQALQNKNNQEMQEANVEKKTNILQVSKRSSTGMNLNSQLAKKELNDNTYEMYERGYGHLQIEGEWEDGSKFNFDSKKDAPYVSIIDDEIKDDIECLREESKKGIVVYFNNYKNKKEKKKKIKALK